VPLVAGLERVLNQRRHLVGGDRVVGRAATAQREQTDHQHPESGSSHSSLLRPTDPSRRPGLCSSRLDNPARTRPPSFLTYRPVAQFLALERQDENVGGHGRAAWLRCLAYSPLPAPRSGRTCLTVPSLSATSNRCVSVPALARTRNSRPFRPSPLIS